MLFALLTQQGRLATLTGAATVAGETSFDLVVNLEAGERTSRL
jgi:hypothetical protein